MISLLSTGHQRKLMKKWAPILESGAKIESEYTKLALAQCLENTRNEFARKGLLMEADSIGNSNKQPRATTIGNFSNDGVMRGKLADNPATADRGYGDFYTANIVMPMLRRIFPDLIANELVGVQPLNGPIGFALAYRALYKGNGHLLTGDDTTSAEVGFAPTDAEYTGKKADDPEIEAGSEAEKAWKAYTGDNQWNGEGVDLGLGEYAGVYGGADDLDSRYPTMTFDLRKVAVQAKTRKLGAQWSPELAEDLEATQGIDVEAEMVNLLSYEIGAEIDRQIITEMVKAAITGGSITKWNPKEADGLDQMGRLATLLTQITIEANQIAIRTKRGAGNFVITSPKVCALLEQMSMNKFVSMGAGKSIPSVPQNGVGTIQKQGLINDGQQLLIRDAYATGDYILMGYKGTHPGDSGIIYCPYIPVQLSKAMRPDTFTPTVGARTRYGVMNTPWDSGRYYAMINIEGLDGGNMGTYAWGADRMFIQKPSEIKYDYLVK